MRTTRAKSPPPRVRSRLGATHIDVLHLLVVGDTLKTIASKLHLAPRTVDIRIAELMGELAAQTRFHAGSTSVGRGYVEAGYVCQHAAINRRFHDRWIEPTMRQREILQLLAQGARVGQAAQVVGVSARTARREVSFVAAANGAPNDWAIGALASDTRVDVTRTSQAHNSAGLRPARPN